MRIYLQIFKVHSAENRFHFLDKFALPYTFEIKFQEFSDEIFIFDCVLVDVMFFVFPIKL